MSSSAKRPGRLGGTKSKTGCDTCKIRRVRCGEEKPHCLRCTSTGRRCAYGGGHARTFIGRLQPDITPYTSQGSRERRSFEFYFHQAGPSLSGVLDQAFWRGSVLQICRVEPLIWDAIISLSALYERPPIYETSPWSLINDPAAVRHEYHHEALVWYSRSLALLQQRINQGTADLTVSLVSCILFIAIELLQGSRKAAQILYKHGAQLVFSASSTATSTIATLEPIFRRLGTWVFLTNGLPEESCDLHLAVPDEQFKSIEEARNVLCSIVAEMKALNIDSKAYIHRTADGRLHEVSELAARQQHLKTRLAQWYRLFIDLNPMLTSNVDGATALLLMTYKSVFIEAEAMLNPDQSVYDAYESEFAQIIDLAPTAVSWTRSSEGKQPPFMFEMGVFLPLFITGLKCPFPQLRRQALRYMGEAPPAQGLFMCTPAAHIVAILIGLEENPDTMPEKVSQVYELLAKPGHIPPAQHRTCDFSVSSVMDRHGRTRNLLNYTLYHFDDEGRIQIVEKTLPFPA
ncbi:transcriptional regulator family: Fungal Specific TF [Penicillium roqueforti]|nr:transcriptional regulator family: Fungal Specific TF [Penicillium roqueforti]KAI3122647.1 transcriptional regulator family: Fungal Specific TF [Penicillium roqueforti]